jgi:hypothetical protein
MADVGPLHWHPPTQLAATLIATPASPTHRTLWLQKLPAPETLNQPPTTVTVNDESVKMYPITPARITSSDPNVETDRNACPRKSEFASATSKGVEERNTMKVSTLVCFSKLVLVKMAS